MDIELYYQEKGKGIPLILLHGNGENSDYFTYQIEKFSEDYRVIAIDTRGHGKSARGNAPFTISQFACDLHDFMCNHQIEDAIILGFSDGANIAMKFALKHPEMVKALILNGGNLNPKGVKFLVQLPIEIGYRITRLFAWCLDSAKKNFEILGLMVNDPNIKINEIRRIHAPTLVICGTKDMIKESHTRQIAKEIPNSQLSMIEGDHFIAYKQYRVFNEEVSNFLKMQLDIIDNNKAKKPLK